MTLDQAIDYVGSQKELAYLLGVSESAISNWKVRSCIPTGQQLKLEIMTQGRIRADEKIFAKKY
jgi:DNA-binding transcriptional regulator YdaS (Cro superfamily)